MSHNWWRLGGWDPVDGTPPPTGPVIGGPDSWAFLVQWDGTTWSDESGYVLAAGDAVKVTRGRGSEADTAQPGTLALTLDNTTGRFTPDNPLSPLWPNVADGPRCRFTVTRGGVTSSRFRGRLTLGAPDLPGGQLAQACVDVLAADTLGALSGDRLRCDYVEQWISAVSADIWPFESVTTEVTPNVSPQAAGTAKLVPAVGALGTAEVAAPEGIVLDSSVVLTTSAGAGPVVVASVDSFVRHSADYPAQVVVTFRCAERVAAGGTPKTIACGLAPGDVLMWVLRLVDHSGRTDLELWDGTSLQETLVTGWAPVGAESGDDQWYAFRLLYDLGGSARLTRISDGAEVTTTAGTIIALTTAAIILGGLGTVRSPGKQTQCVTASFGALAAAADLWDFVDRLRPGVAVASLDRVTEVTTVAGVTATVSGARSRQIARSSTSGRSPFDVLTEVALTTGALLAGNPDVDDALRWVDSDALRLPPPAMLDLDAEEDLNGAPGLPWRKGEAPGSVTAKWWAGSVTLEAGEAGAERSIDTCAIDTAGARDAASLILTGSRRLRLTQLTVDVAGAANDLWAAVMGLQLGARIRLQLGAASSQLARHYGLQYVDLYVVGWSEAYGEGLALWTIDTVPADDPVEGVFDDADRGRYCAGGASTVTGGTAVGTTGTGTVIVTTAAAGVPWSTAAGDYPLTLDWSGEWVTVTSPPASSTSPQTFTVTARGVGPTIARAHAAGEPVDVALPAAYTI